MLSDDPEALRKLQKMDIVGVGGAAIPKSVGDFLVSRNVNLISRFGSAECGFLLTSGRDYARDKEWQFLRLPENSPYLKFEEQSDEPGLFELVVLKGWPHKAKTNREDGSFATSDLFEKHDSIMNGWKYHSRSDSQITLVTGKKFDPAPVEDAIASSLPIIREVLVFGNDRQFPGALIVISEEGLHIPHCVKAAETLEESHCLKNNVPTRKMLTDTIWAEVQKINLQGQNHTRISKDMIILLDGQTSPFERSSKGTVLRSVVNSRFAKEIQDAYNAKYEPRVPSEQVSTVLDGMFYFALYFKKL